MTSQSIRAIHIAKAVALATALSALCLILLIFPSSAMIVDDAIKLHAPKPFPNIQLQSDGDVLRPLRAYRGRPVLLNFWATWCPPCVKELPALNSLQSRYADEGLMVVTLSQDAGGIDVVKRFFAEHNIQLTPYADPRGAAFKELNIGALPTSYLINADGTLAATIDGIIGWTDKVNISIIESWLAQN